MHGFLERAGRGAGRRDASCRVRLNRDLRSSQLVSSGDAYLHDGLLILQQYPAVLVAGRSYPSDVQSGRHLLGG